MVWSTVLQLGLGAANMFQANRQYQDGLRAQREALRMQGDLAARNYGLAMDAQRAQTEENEYIRQREILDRMAMQDQQGFQRAGYSDYLDQLFDERQYGMDRQVMLDRDAAANRAFQLQQVLQNQQLSAQERAFALEQLRLAQEIASSERDFSLDIYRDEADRMAERQRMLDKDARDIQLYRLQEAARNRELRADERAFAQELLGQQGDIAQQERDERLARLLEDREMKGEERNFMIDQYQDLLATARGERADEMAIRDQIISGAGDLQSQLERAANQMGYIPEIEQVTPEMIQGEIARRADLNTAMVDRAADRVASINEADLIRSGMDVSSTADERRADIAKQLALEYQQAQSSAYDDAMSYITGRSNLQAQNVNNIIGRRGSVLDEIAGIGSTELNALQNLRQAPTVTTAYNMAASIGSGVYDRDIGSAGNYTSPVGVSSAFYDASGMMTPSYGNYDYDLLSAINSVGSAGTYSSPVALGSGIYDNFNIMSGVGNTMNLGSAASQGYNQIGSGILAPYNQTLMNPSSYFSYGDNSQNNTISALMGQYNQGMDAMSGMSENLGSIFSGLTSDYDARQNRNLYREEHGLQPATNPSLNWGGFKDFLGFS